MRIPLLLLALGVFACSNPGEPPAVDTIPIDTSSAPGDTGNVVAALGRYTIAQFDSVTPVLPTDTPDGSFLRIASSTGNDRVGTVNGRLAVWPAGAGAPTYMFPADTQHGLTAFRINTRLEVALVHVDFHGEGAVYMWRSGQLKQLTNILNGGWSVAAFNNRGTLVVSRFDAGNYENFGILRSPFSPEIIPSTRLAGKTCAQGRRTSRVTAINDDDEVLANIQVNPGGPQETMWIALAADGSQKDCLDLTETLINHLPTPVSFNILGAAGRIAGTTGGAYPTAVITEGAHVAAVDALLVDQSLPRKWHVTQVIAIDRNQVITARAIRTSDNATVLVKLTPEAK